MSTDWQQVLFDPKNKLIERLEYLANKRFWDSNIADESINWVLDSIKKDNWARLNAFDGKAKPSTYLTSIFFNSLENFAHKKYGRKMPKTWLKAMGDFWVQIWKRLCLEREDKDHLIFSVSDGSIEKDDEIKNIIRTIKSKEPKCGELEAETSIDEIEDINNIPEKSVHEQSSDKGSQIEELLYVLGIMAGLNKPKLTDSEIINKIEALASMMALIPEEQLVLQLTYQESMPNVKIGKMLDMSAYKVKQMHDDIINRLGEIFTQTGIHLDEIYE